MTTTGFLAILALITLGAVCVFALWSKSKVESRMHDDDAPKSTLAADKNSHGEPVDV